MIKPETIVRDRLQRIHGGVCEARCKGGNIDLLTPTEVIEVKQVKSWKSALGQILVYGEYYPSRLKRLHLFGVCTDSYLKIIKDHCKSYGVNVTTEDDQGDIRL